MPENTRMATLNQEMIRRMINTSELVDHGTRLNVIDDYARKLINSEYDLAMTRRIVVGGLKGYERMLSLSLNRDNQGWKPLHLPTSYKARERRVVKMMAKTNWFKSREEQGLENNQPPGRCFQPSGRIVHPSGTSIDTPGGVKVMEPTVGRAGSQGRWKKKRGDDRPTLSLGGRKRMEKATRKKERRKINRQLGRAGIEKKDNNPAMRKGKNIPTISVLFVEQTPGGALARNLQKAEVDLGLKTGYRIRIVENAGSALKMILPSTNPWGNIDCQRNDCLICSQGDEEVQDCRRRNILYENRCTVCQVGKEGDTFQKDGLGIYVGESSRSLYERSKEHEKDRNDEQEESHQLKHWVLDHPELDAPPKFKFKLISSFADPLTRQISEAVRIEQRGELILNSKSEFNRCRVPRLKIDMEGWKAGKEREKQEKIRKAKEAEPSKVGDEIDGTEWHDEDDQVGLELSEVETQSRRMENKRKRMEEPKKQEERKKKEKKRKFDKLVNWGELFSIQEEADQPHEDSSGQLEDWLIRQEVEKEERTRDWLLSETQQPQKKLRQMNLEIPVLVKKAGQGESSVELKKTGAKPKFRFNKTGKFTKKEVKEVQRTSKNIFDWFKAGNRNEHPLLDRAGAGEHVHGGESGVGGMLLFADGHQDNPREDMDTDPSTTGVVGAESNMLEDDRDEKGERLRRMETRRCAWANRRMVRELVLGLVETTSTMSVTAHIKNMVVKEILADAVMRSEMNKIMESLESLDGMEARVFTELVEREEKRRKQSRLARRIEKEAMWLARRQEEDKQRLMSGAVAGSVGSHQTDEMEWEEHDLEYQMASLGLEMGDLFMTDNESEEDKDWLDVWMESLIGVEESSKVPMCLVMEDDTMEITILEEQDRDVDFMTWLVEELREMQVEDRVIETISECVRTASCPGGCQETCEVEDKQICCEGSIMQSAQGSTQNIEVTQTYSDISDECIRSMACLGDCQGICRIEACLIIHGSNSMQEDQGSTQDMHGTFSTKPNTQEFGMPRENILLEPQSGRVGGFGSARNCVLREGSRDRDNPVSASVQTVHTNCTLVRLKNQNTMALDWARVGGVVHEVWGECKTDENIWKPKYEPNLDKLPVWRHPRFKPGCSRKQEKIYFEKIYFEDNRDTISSLYRQEYLQTEGEEETNRRGRRLSGRVGEEVRRLEEGVGVGGVWLETGEEDMACKSQTEGVKKMKKQSRIVRRGGRVSGSATS